MSQFTHTFFRWWWRFIACLSIAFGLIESNSALAQTNGCGSGWNRPFVPDSIPLKTCEFRTSCDSHDVCYGRCTNVRPDRPPHCEYLRCKAGGDLAGKQVCDDDRYIQLGLAAKNRKAVCDTVFYSDIIKANPSRSVCRVFARIYKEAVVRLGTSSFTGVDGQLNPGLTKAQIERSDAAIAELFEKLNEEELRAYELELATGTAKVDFTKELSFSLSRRLFNRSQP